ncbi:unnamed protein product, partial [Iphiclides podalirius]
MALVYGQYTTEIPGNSCNSEICCVAPPHILANLVESRRRVRFACVTSNCNPLPLVACTAAPLGTHARPTSALLRFGIESIANGYGERHAGSLFGDPLRRAFGLRWRSR